MQTSMVIHNSQTVISRPRPIVTNLILVANDLFGLTLGLVLAAIVVSLPPNAGASEILVRFAPLVTIVPLGFIVLGLYPAAGMSPIDEMRILSISLTVVYALLVSFVALGYVADSRTYLAMAGAWFATVITVASGRVLARHVLAHRAWWGVPVVVLGAGKTAELVIARLRLNPGLNLKVVHCLDDDPRKQVSMVSGVPVSGTLSDAAALKRANGINYAIVAIPSLEPQGLSLLVQELGTLFASVVVIPNAFGMTSVGVGTRDSGGIIGLHVRGHLSLRSNRIAKRVIDLLLLLPLGLLSLPLIGIAAAMVVVTSPGNPFYSQEREGFRGQKIRVWKLRTMRLDVGGILERHLAANPTARAEWETHFKLARDPRVIPVVGTLLRRMSLDELPQVYNILRGEMSFVGPRPFPYYHLDQFDQGFRRLRVSVVPGLTGYWQVTSRSTADLVMQIELDSYYITNWSLWFDLYVIARTPWAILFGTGAH